jgi:hypothetical protein
LSSPRSTRSWPGKNKKLERDTRFVELGSYPCEVRAGQNWKVENLKSFDEFLARRFPEARRKEGRVYKSPILVIEQTIEKLALMLERTNHAVTVWK